MADKPKPVEVPWSFFFWPETLEAIALQLGLPEGKTPDRRELNVWLEVETEELFGDLHTQYGSDKYRAKNRSIGRRDRWERQLRYQKLLDGECPEPMRMVWDVHDEHGNRVPPPLSVVKNEEP